MSQCNSNQMSQHITYNKWLPLVLGLDFMEELDIGPINYGYSKRYNPKVRPHQESREFSFHSFHF